MLEEELMAFECTRHHPKCKALCCRVAPIEKEIFERNIDKIVRPTDRYFEFEGTDPLSKKKLLLVLPITEDGYCPFSNKDLTCNIYEDRPDVCRKYGTEVHTTMCCPYQDKNGRERSRQESRKILREADKGAEKLLSIRSRRLSTNGGRKDSDYTTV